MDRDEFIQRVVELIESICDQGPIALAAPEPRLYLLPEHLKTARELMGVKLSD